jgi:putative transposase
LEEFVFNINVGLYSILLCLAHFYEDYYTLVYGKNNNIRTGRHCVFNTHAHRIFVTKYREKVLDGKAIDIFSDSFSEICQKFEADMVEFNGEYDHVHLLIHYPPKMAISTLVNSLKGISYRILQKRYPEIAHRYTKNVLWSPNYFAASCEGLQSLL